MKNFHIIRYFKVWQFSRLLKNGKLFVTETYKDNLQTYSAAAQYIDNNNQLHLGILHCSVKVKNYNCEIQNSDFENMYFAIIGQLFCNEVFRMQGDNFRYDSRNFLQKCVTVNNLITILIASLCSTCIYINIENQVFIGLPVNQKELE